MYFQTFQSLLHWNSIHYLHGEFEFHSACLPKLDWASSMVQGRSLKSLLKDLSDHSAWNGDAISEYSYVF